MGKGKATNIRQNIPKKKVGNVDKIHYSWLKSETTHAFNLVDIHIENNKDITLFSSRIVTLLLCVELRDNIASSTMADILADICIQHMYVLELF